MKIPRKYDLSLKWPDQLKRPEENREVIIKNKSTKKEQKF